MISKNSKKNLYKHVPCTGVRTRASTSPYVQGNNVYVENLVHAPVQGNNLIGGIKRFESPNCDVDQLGL